MIQRQIQNDTYVLAVSWGHSDPAVAISSNGKIVAYVEEERLSRVKHAFGNFPILALRECLSIAKIKLSDITLIAINWDLERFENGSIKEQYAKINLEYTPEKSTLDWQRENLRKYTTKTVKQAFFENLAPHFESLSLPPIVSFGHHYIHAWQAAIMSGYSDALVLVIDGSGDDMASSIWKYDGKDVTPKRVVKLPHSLGWFYAAITEFLGFQAYDGEHKVMAMSAYGKATSFLDKAIAEILCITEREYKINPKFIHDGPHTYSGRFTDQLIRLLKIKPKNPSDKFEKIHFDLAAAAQRQLNKAVTNFLNSELSVARTKNVCFSGGVALNVTLSAHLQNNCGIDHFFANPLASDAGAIVGSALRADSHFRHSTTRPIEILSLGRSYSRSDIRYILDSERREYTCLEGEYSRIVTLLQNGCLVAWMYGGAEAGPRALGNRSILCDPTNATAVSKLTMEVKNRHSWQPYGLSIPNSHVHEYLAIPVDSHNMSIAVPTTKTLQDKIPALIHPDGTLRPQIVHKNKNPEFFDLLQLFGNSSGVYALLNTSLNRRGEPMAYSPNDAITIFDETTIDALIIEDILLLKKQYL